MPDDIIVICTANVARSPLFAARLQLSADAVHGAGALTVSSGGTTAIFDQPAAPGSVALAAQWGVDLTDHRSRPLPYLDLDAAALIIVMTRAHRREVVRHAPDSARRIHLLRPLVRAAPDALRAAGRPGGAPGASTQPSDPATSVLEEGVGALNAIGAPRARRRDDVPDPLRGDAAVYDTLGEEFVRAASSLGPVLFGRPGPGA